MSSFDYSYNTSVKSAYIIRIAGNEISERMAERCALSCQTVQMPYELYDGVDGTSGELKNIPDQQITKLLKFVNKTLTPAEIGCVLSHFFLWVKCIEFDQPIVILEHDAVMVQPYYEHPFFNVISYLGCNEQATGWDPQFPMPPHGQMNENYRFMLRTHAYAVDPMVARNLVAKIIKSGVYTSADVMVRADEFPIIQFGVFAYDMPGQSIIPKLSDEIPESVKINNKIYG